MFGLNIADIDKLVREGAPCEPTGKDRSPLVFNCPVFFRWYSIRKAYEHSEMAGRLAEKDWQINDLELELEKARAS